MKFSIENEKIKASFKSLGAETISVFDKTKNLELLWQGSKDSWTSQATNLFPVIGRLKNFIYTHEGKEYGLKSHGFARNSEFMITEQTSDSITFLLSDSADTLALYPFKFNFTVKYELKGNKLITNYLIKNTDKKIIYFGVGGHPGFNLPHTEESSQTKIDGNKIFFEHEENPEQFIFEQDEVLIKGIRPYGKLTEIDLKKELFAHDALLLKNLKSKYVILERTDGVKIKFWFNNAPYLAFWTNPNRGGYICIEPWCGLPDYFTPSRELKDKEGINSLAPDDIFHYNYDIEVMD